MTARTLVVGTAGHVDHGKSALVKALTGTDPDRLAEEHARGLTIDLGFAWCVLPGGTVASFVDVPGHEDFIRNMLAGVGGMAAAVLVIAADEGPMPQTHEHLAILHLLGIRHGLVALTKTDLAPDPDWRAMVEADVRDLLAPTTLAGAPIVPVSALTGEGLDSLISVLEGVLGEAPDAIDAGRPRLAVDRVFTLAGHGTVVTGTLKDGALSVGDALELLPHGQRTRARALHSHGRAIDVAPPGTRVAVNLAGLDVSELERGDVVVHAGTYPTSRLLDVSLELLPGAPVDLEHDDEVQLFHGAGHVQARVRLIGKQALKPGETGFAQLALTRAEPVAAGDRFVLRRPSPGSTIGGGRVLDPTPRGRRARFRQSVLARFAALDSGEPTEVVWHRIAELEPCPAYALRPVELGLEEPAIQAALDALKASGRAAHLGPRWVTDARLRSLRERAASILGTYHRRFPLRDAAPREELRERLDLPADAFAPWLDLQLVEGWLAREGDGFRLASHAVRLDASQASRSDALLQRFHAAPFAPPSRQEAEAAVGPELLASLIAGGELVAIGGDVLLGRTAYAAMRDAVMSHLADSGEITVAQLRDRFNTSRKYALAFLEFLDRERVTRRVGDARVAARPLSPARQGGQQPGEGVDDRHDG